MQPLNEDELNQLLRQWDAPAAPPSLERRIFEKPREPWYRWLLTGSVRIPVPVLALLVLAMSALTLIVSRTWQPSPTPVREVSFSEYRPVRELQPRIIRRSYEGN